MGVAECRLPKLNSRPGDGMVGYKAPVGYDCSKHSCWPEVKARFISRSHSQRMHKLSSIAVSTTVGRDIFAGTRTLHNISRV